MSKIIFFNLNNFFCRNYFKILFKHDPKKPLNSFWLHLVMLRMVGLWTPENKLWKPAYRIYSNFYAIVWVLFFLCTQAYFFMNVTSIPDVADALFFFLNELMLLPKIYYYRKNATLMKKIVAKLESENFLPKNKDEEKYVRKTMAHTTFNHRYLIANTYVVILNWAFSAYFNHKNNTGNKFLMPARFPVKKDIIIDAEFIFTITLSIQNFLSIMRASYSYFAVLQSLG
uniref:CSON003793 protein n=1 Tax=Culicoides sonorensis TaxID=179676 RepID=A0A336MM79_CULSO